MSRTDEHLAAHGGCAAPMVSHAVERSLKRLHAELETRTALASSDDPVSALEDQWSGGRTPSLVAACAGKWLYQSGHGVSIQDVGSCCAAIGEITEALDWLARGGLGPQADALAIDQQLLEEGPGLSCEPTDPVEHPLKQSMCLVVDDQARDEDLARTGALARGFRAHGWTLSIIVYRTPRASDGRLDAVSGHLEGFTVTCIDGPTESEDRIARMHTVSGAVEQVIRSARPEVLHVAASTDIALAACAGARRTGVPVVLEVRGLGEYDRMERVPCWAGSEQHQLQRRLEMQAMIWSNMIVTSSDAIRGELLDRGMPPDRIVVLPNGVDSLAFDVTGDEPSVADGSSSQVVIGYVGSLDEPAALEDLIAAFEHVTAVHGAGPRMVIIGQGPVERDLRAQIASAGLQDRVEFVDTPAMTDRPACYDPIDICVYPSSPWFESDERSGSAIRPLEALAKGKAVVVADVSSLTALIDHDRTGMCYPAGDAGALGDLLDRLVGDQRLRDRLGRSAREWVEARRDWMHLTASVDAIHAVASDVHVSPDCDGITRPVEDDLPSVVDRSVWDILEGWARFDSQFQELDSDSRSDRVETMASAISHLQGQIASLKRNLAGSQSKYRDVVEALGRQERERTLHEDTLRTVQREREVIRKDLARMSTSSGMALSAMISMARDSVKGRILLPFRMSRFVVDKGYRARWKRLRLQKGGLKAEVEQVFAQLGPRAAANVVWHRWTTGQIELKDVLRHVYGLFKDGWRTCAHETLGHEITRTGLAHGHMLLKLSGSDDLRQQLIWRYRKVGMSEDAAELDATTCDSVRGEVGDEDITRLRAIVHALPGDPVAGLESGTDKELSQQEILDRCLRDGVEACEQWVRGWVGPGESSQVDRLMWESLKDSHKAGVHAEGLLRDAVRYGRRLGIGLKYLQWRSHRVGDIIDSVAMRRKLPLSDRKGNVRWDDHEAKVRLLMDGRPFPDVAPSPQRTGSTALYVLHNSLPLSSAGYATRTHGLLRSLRDEGIDAQGVTRPGYPWDRFPEDEQPEGVEMLDIIDGVPYHRTDNPRLRYRDVPIDQYLDSFESIMGECIAQHDPCLIHAASNFMNGIAAGSAARRAGLPWIYEVRGLWEITRVSRQPSWEGSHEFRFHAGMERDAAQHADLVITLTTGLRDELMRRGIDSDRIVLVPNGVNASRFTPRAPDEDLREELGIGDRTVIGYIGSTVSYEGLDDLLDATSVLRDMHGDSFRLMVVGDGLTLKSLQEKAARLGLHDHVIFTGRVPHEDVERYYSLIDISPFPRKPQIVCEMVSPLKPFEAMALTKAVVASDVQALRDIVQDGVTGLLFEKGSTTSLVSALDRLMRDSALRDDLGEAARAWVMAERDWSVLGHRMAEIYRSLVPSGVLESRAHQGVG